MGFRGVSSQTTSPSESGSSSEIVPIFRASSAARVPWYPPGPSATRRGERCASAAAVAACPDE